MKRISPFRGGMIIASALVAVAACGLLLSDLGRIRHPVWDENYYLATTARYHLGRLQLASHPPLGLMLIAAGDRLSGLNAGLDWRAMAAVQSVPGELVPDGFDYRGIRLASALAGVAAALVFLWWMRALIGRVEPALMLSFLFLADPALLVQFRAGHLDAFEVLFALLALWGALHWRRADTLAWRFALLTGASVAAAALVRVNGAGLVVMLPLVAALRGGAWRRRCWELAMAVSAGALVVLAVYAAHMAASPQMPDPATPAGQRDQAYVSRPFREASDPAHRLIAIIADQRAFWRSDLHGMAQRDGNASHPWGWPLGLGAITYRWDAGHGRSGEGWVRVLALLPNRVAWLLSSFGVLAGAALFVRNPKSAASRDAAVLLAVWAAQMAGFLWLDGQRVLYLYHYFLALMAGYGLLALAWRGAGTPMRAGWIGVGAVLCGFALLAPVALHHVGWVGWCQRVAPSCGPFPAP